MTTEIIRNHPVMQRILADSFGGVMYDTANRSKYDASEILFTWEHMTESQRDAAGGIIKGAIGFLNEVQV